MINSIQLARSPKQWAVLLCVLGAFVLANCTPGPNSGSDTESNPETESTSGQMFQDRFMDGLGQGPEMVVLPIGEFTMGSPETEKGRDSDEGRQRIVQIGYEFAVGRHEVTFAQWDACVADGGCGSYRPEDKSWGRENRPVINVSWEDAQAYLYWLNQKTGLTGRPDRYRLLTEAEWEYAARSGSQTPWSFGDDESRLENFAWFDSNSGSRTQLVGNKTMNRFGLHDMHGNVWEWVEDCYSASYSGAPSDGSAGATEDCFSRVYRGGSSNAIPASLRSAYRNWGTPGDRKTYLGFRVAKTVSQTDGPQSTAPTQPMPSSAPAAETTRQVNLDFPYYALVTCELHGKTKVNITNCFYGGQYVGGTELELRNGDQYGLYRYHELGSKFGDPFVNGLRLELRQNFELTAQNASDGLILSVRIFESGSNTKVFEKSASRFGVVAVTHDSLASAPAAETTGQAGLDFPYYALITCELHGHHRFLRGCLGYSPSQGGANTEMELRNGSEYKLYDPTSLLVFSRDNETAEGLRIKLRSNFELTAQNSSDLMTLRVRIFESGTNTKVFEDGAAQYGVIKVVN